MIIKKNEIEDHINVLEDFTQGSHKIISHFLDNYKLNNQIDLNMFTNVSIKNSLKKNLSNYHKNYTEFYKILSNNLVKNGNQNVKGEYKELLYEIKIVLKDSEAINSDKNDIENELNILKKQENLTKRSSYNQSSFSENRSSKSSQSIKYSTNLSARSTQLSIVEMKKDIEDRKKVVKHYEEKSKELEDNLSTSKSILNEKSKLSEKILAENEVKLLDLIKEMKLRIYQNESIINQLKNEISIIKCKKNRNLSGFVNENEMKNSINNLSYNNSKEHNRKEKGKNSFMGFVKSILSKN